MGGGAGATLGYIIANIPGAVAGGEWKPIEVVIGPDSQVSPAIVLELFVTPRVGAWPRCLLIWRPAKKLR